MGIYMIKSYIEFKEVETKTKTRRFDVKGG